MANSIDTIDSVFFLGREGGFCVSNVEGWVKSHDNQEIKSLYNKWEDNTNTNNWLMAGNLHNGNLLTFISPNIGVYNNDTNTRILTNEKGLSLIDLFNKNQMFRVFFVDYHPLACVIYDAKSKEFIITKPQNLSSIPSSSNLPLHQLESTPKAKSPTFEELNPRKKYRFSSRIHHKRLLTILLLGVVAIAMGFSLFFHKDTISKPDFVNFEKLIQNQTLAIKLAEESTIDIKSSEEMLTKFTMEIDQASKEIKLDDDQKTVILRHVDFLKNSLSKYIDTKPRLVFDLKTIGKGANSSRFFVTGNLAYFLDQNQSKIYSLNLDKKSTQTIINPKIASIVNGSKYKGKIFWLSGNTVLLQKNKEVENIYEVSTELDNGGFFDVYVDNLYFLNKNGVVFKQATMDSSASAYLQEEIYTKDARGIEVGGQIYTYSKKTITKQSSDGELPFDNSFLKDEEIMKVIYSAGKIFSRSRLIVSTNKNKIFFVDEGGKVEKVADLGQSDKISDFDVSDSGRFLYILKNSLLEEIDLL